MSWHPTLSSIEGKADNPWDRPRPLTDTQRRESALEPIGSGDCWCGQPYQHPWPGKDAGAPHPEA